MNRLEKEACVAAMRDQLQSAQLVIVARQVGLTVDEVGGLRREMRGANSCLRVMKNTLARLAVQGTALEGLTPYLTGTTALAYSEDPVNAAKVLAKFAKANDKLTIQAGSLNGQILDEASIKALAALPSLDVLRGQLIGLLGASATKIVRTIKEPSACIARVVSSRPS